jgi:hypothetical protein
VQVLWTNQDGTAHTVTADDSLPLRFSGSRANLFPNVQCARRLLLSLRHSPLHEGKDCRPIASAREVNLCTVQKFL